MRNSSNSYLKLSSFKSKNFPIITICLVLFLFAYSSHKSVSAEKKIDSCSLVTKAEAESVLGGPVGEPERREFGGGEGQGFNSTCTYSTKSEYAIKSATIMVTKGFGKVSPEEFAKDFEEGMKENMGMEVSLQPISGIGDSAYVYEEGRQVIVLKDGYQLYITSDSAKENHSAEAAKTLAKKAADRLP
ncbi:MAG TPA: hypothetical protein VHT73_14490 [Thermodesulfobacteriota bacterium]|nr:hypothetical protein [Thermodesulfobacteriota bacterium]